MTTVGNQPGIIMARWLPPENGVLPVAAYRWVFGVSAVLFALALAIYLFSRDPHPGAHGMYIPAKDHPDLGQDL